MSSDSLGRDEAGGMAGGPEQPQQLQSLPEQEAAAPACSHDVDERTSIHADAQQQQQQPRFLQDTHVMPKRPLEEYTHAGQDAIKSAFSTASCTGIRSLPNALANDFRQRLFEHLVATHEQERTNRRLAAAQGEEGTAAQQQQQQQLISNSQGTLRHSTQKPISRVHPLSGAFSTYDYMPSIYEHHRDLEKFERLRNKLAQVNPMDFVLRGPPAGPKGAPSFSRFEASRDPFLTRREVDVAEERAKKEHILAGAFVTSKRVDTLSLLRGKADEAMLKLCRLLSEDWPTAFLQVFEDVSGGIVASFDGARAMAEGDLSTYMQNLARNHPLTAEYHLSKDGTQWGVVDEDAGVAFWLFWPPWCRHRYKPNASGTLEHAA